jgi:hypothetical protein
MAFKHTRYELICSWSEVCDDGSEEDKAAMPNEAMLPLREGTDTAPTDFGYQLGRNASTSGKPNPNLVQQTSSPAGAYIQHFLPLTQAPTQTRKRSQAKAS